MKKRRGRKDHDEEKLALSSKVIHSSEGVQEYEAEGGL